MKHKIRRLRRISRNTLDIGIDRVVFKTLNLKNIDAKLLRHSFHISEGGDIFRVMIDKTGEELKVNCIKVKSSEEQPLKITSLDVGVKKIKTLNKPYEYLDVTLPKMFDGEEINVNNISSLMRFKRSLRKIEEELKSLGFIDVDLGRAQVEELEINVNVPLQKNFYEYEGALRYLKSLLPKTLRRGQSYRDRLNNQYTGFKAFNNSVSIKFYDKRKQILEEHKKDIGYELLRIEYRMLKAEKVKGFIGTIEVNDILNNFSCIAESFKKRLEKDLISKIQKDINTQINETAKVLKKYKKAGKNVIDSCLKNDKIIDIEILLGALKKVEISNIYMREARKAIKSAGEINKESLFGNIKRLNEILQLLGYKKIKIETTKTVEEELKNAMKKPSALMGVGA